ncbi:hypothetical protein ACOSP7_020948 [Xanthoceras sorbifolium]
MAAAVCGGKRSFFEDIPSSPPVSKRPRGASTTSPPSFTPPQLVLDRLRAVFPHIDPQLLERALEECNYDLDYAIKNLNQLCLGTAEEKSASVEELGVIADQGTSTVDGNAAASENQSDQNKLPVDGAEWVDLFVREMLSATSMDDLKSRASRVLEILEKSIMARSGDEAAKCFEKENMTLKEQIEILVRENSILKRAVAIQHERQKELSKAAPSPDVSIRISSNKETEQRDGRVAYEIQV